TDDDGFDELIDDEGSNSDIEDGSEDEVDEKKDVKGKRAKGGKGRLALKAKELGYMGDFFSGKRDGVDSMPTGDFASLEDFETLIEQGNESTSEAEHGHTDGNRKRKSVSFWSMLGIYPGKAGFVKARAKGSGKQDMRYERPYRKTLHLSGRQIR
ncbi:hypothetical protein HDU67_001137, partial [Dinochytrium kinnereticum]